MRFVNGIYTVSSERRTGIIVFACYNKKADSSAERIDSMKKRYKGTAALIGLLLLFSCCLQGCGTDSSVSVLTLGDVSISENVYHYWASTYKGDFLYRYEDVKNTEDFWSGELIDGKSAAEYFDTIILENIQYTLVCMQLFDEYGLVISASEKEDMQERVSDYLKEYADGNRNLVNQTLGEYGINMKLLEKIYIDDAKTAKVYDYLYGENGQTPIDDTQMELYYQENYVHLQMIFINNKYRYKTDSNGKYVMDEKGQAVTEELDADTKARRDESIQKVQEGLENGESFAALYETYSELKAYKNGYYFSKGTVYNDPIYYDLIQKAMEMELQDIAVVEGDYGTCIIQRLELDEDAWKNKDNADFFDGFENTVGDTVFRKFLRGRFDDIQVDEDAIAAYSIGMVTPNYTF